MPLAKKTILIVDDEKDLRELVGCILQDKISGLEIAEADNGIEAISKIENQVFDLLITDVRMPGMDGQRLLGAIAELPGPQRPKAVIVIAAQGNPQAVSHFGSCTFISKTLDSATFVSLVRDKLGRSSLG
ncbi:response regulator [Bdellovibrionota bacterium FG-2]